MPRVSLALSILKACQWCPNEHVENINIQSFVVSAAAFVRCLLGRVLVIAWLHAPAGNQSQDDDLVGREAHLPGNLVAHVGGALLGFIQGRLLRVWRDTLRDLIAQILATGIRHDVDG